MTSVQNNLHLLNELCESDQTITSVFDDSNIQFMNNITSTEWISWLNNYDGRNKLAKFVKKNKNKNEYLPSWINYIKNYIIHLSVSDGSRLTDEIWSSVKDYDKKIVLGVMTLPYPDLNDKHILRFHNVKIQHDNNTFRCLNVALKLLRSFGFDVYKSEQMTRYLNLILQFINNMILNKEITKFKFLKHYLNKLFFILFHPKHHHNNKITGLDIFINYMVSDGKCDLFVNDDAIYIEEFYYKDLKIFGNSADHYLEEARANINDKKNHNHFIKLNKHIEEDWWKFVCNTLIFCKNFKYHDQADGHVSKINNISKENPLFMNKMIECAKLLRKMPSEAIVILKNEVSEFVKYKIFKDSKEGGCIAALIYEAIGVPCLDILASDSYVNSLSDDDKEILTLWTHACNLLQHRPQHSEEIEDLTRKPFLRSRLYQIFIQAQKTKNSIVLYRGLSKACTRLERISKNPIAVSFDSKVAIGFTNEGKGCLLKIEVPPNSNILAIDRVSIYNGEESEILLMPNNELIDIDTQGDDIENIDTEMAKNEDESENENEIQKEKETISVKFRVKDDINNAIVPVLKPSFIHRAMTQDELDVILIKSELSLDPITILFNIEHDSFSYKTKAQSLFESIRTYQLIYCGFGDVKLAIAEFWKLLKILYRNSPNFSILERFQTYCDTAWLSRKSLVTQNEIAITLDAIQDFVRPFVVV